MRGTCACSPGAPHLHPAPFLASPAMDLGSRLHAAEPSARLSLFVPLQPLSHRVAPGVGGTERLHICAQELEDFGCAQTPGSWDSHIFVSPVLLAFEAKCGAVERGRLRESWEGAPLPIWDMSTRAVPQGAMPRCVGGDVWSPVPCCLPLYKGDLEGAIPFQLQAPAPRSTSIPGLSSPFSSREQIRGTILYI